MELLYLLGCLLLSLSLWWVQHTAEALRPRVPRQAATSSSIARRCRATPIKTGTHTYASWQNTDPGDDEKYSRQSGDYYDDDDDADDEEPFPDDNDDVGGEYDNDVAKTERPSNPIIEWARKLYDSIFFYGLDAQIPTGRRSRRKRERSRAPSRQSSSPRSRVRASTNKLVSQKPKKSLFFTSTETLGEEYISSMERDEQETGTRVAAADSSSSSSKVMVLERRIQVLDECIRGMKVDLGVVEGALVGCGDDGVKEDLLRQKQNLLDAIETMQVQYVALCVESAE